MVEYKTDATNAVTIRARVWRGYGVQTGVWVDDDGVCRVYDDVAGHWTRAHSLSEAACRRARKLDGANRRARRAIVKGAS